MAVQRGRGHRHKISAHFFSRLARVGRQLRRRGQRHDWPAHSARGRQAHGPGVESGKLLRLVPQRDQLGQPHADANPDQCRAFGRVQDAEAPGHLDQPHRGGPVLHHRFGVDGQGHPNRSVGHRCWHVRLRQYPPRGGWERGTVWTQIATAFKSFDSHHSCVSSLACSRGLRRRESVSNLHSWCERGVRMPQWPARRAGLHFGRHVRGVRVRDAAPQLPHRHRHG